MRQIVFVVCAVFGAALLASLGTLSAQAQSQDQYATPDQPSAAAPQAPPQARPPAEPAEGAPAQPPPPPADIDESDAAGLDDRIVNTVAADPYNQVVDDATRKRFSAPGWKREKAAGSYGKSVHEPARRRASSARFKVKVPTAGYYTLYARWPAAKRGGDAVRIGVSTQNGVRWEKVDQTVDGSSWVRVGAYRMAAGDRHSVRVSPGKRGAAVADAVMISKNVLVGKNAGMVSVGGPRALPGGSDPGADRATARPNSSGGGGSGIVRAARAHLGKPYDYDHALCRQGMAREDCSCLTRNVLLGYGWTLPDSPVTQYRYGTPVSKANMKPGDVVFHDLNKNGSLSDPYEDHVSIYTGNGNVIHASSYYGKVVESKESDLQNFWGARRFGSR